MSWILRNLVNSKIVGKSKNPEGPPCSAAARKAALDAYADRANDLGDQIFVSKTRIAAEKELDRETIIKATESLVADGLMQETGKRPGRNGFTYTYKINIGAVRLLPDAWPAKCRNSDTLDDALVEGEEPVGTLLNPLPRRRRSARNSGAKVSESGGQGAGIPDKNSPSLNRYSAEQILSRLQHDEQRVLQGRDPVFLERDAGEKDDFLLARIRQRIAELTAPSKDPKKPEVRKGG